MIRPLDDLVLLKEIDDCNGINYNSSNLRKKYPNKIVIIKRIAYIKKEVLCDMALSQVTDLSDYIQLSVLAEQIAIQKRMLLFKIHYIESIKASGGEIDMFDYALVAGIYFIKLNDKFKNLLQNYQAFLATYEDAKNIKYCQMLGDLKIGFY